MNSLLSRDEASRLGGMSGAPEAGMQGAARLVVRRTDGEDRLAELHQATPLRILFPYPMPGDPFTAALVNTSGGLVGGDRLSIAIEIGTGASALVCAQAAEKVYRSLGPDSRIDLSLSVGQSGWLEMLPQETILFDGARLGRRCRVDLAGDAAFLGGEILVFGRQARGESMRTGLVQDGWEIRRDGQLAWIDRLRLDGDIAGLLAQQAGLGDAKAAANLIFAAPKAGAELDAMRQQVADFPGRASVTLVNGILLARWLSEDPFILRQAFAKAWISLRMTKKMPASLPRLWHI